MDSDHSLDKVVRSVENGEARVSAASDDLINFLGALGAKHAVGQPDGMTVLYVAIVLTVTAFLQGAVEEKRISRRVARVLAANLREAFPSAHKKEPH
jgi:hypothetical protein